MTIVWTLLLDWKFPYGIMVGYISFTSSFSLHKLSCLDELSHNKKKLNWIFFSFQNQESVNLSKSIFFNYVHLNFLDDSNIISTFHSVLYSQPFEKYTALLYPIKFYWIISGVVISCQFVILFNSSAFFYIIPFVTNSIRFLKRKIVNRQIGLIVKLN